MLFREYQKMVFISPMSLIFFSLIHGYVTISIAWCNTIQEPNNIYLISRFQLNTVMHYLRSTIKLNTLFFSFLNSHFQKYSENKLPIVLSLSLHTRTCEIAITSKALTVAFFLRKSVYIISLLITSKIQYGIWWRLAGLA